MNGAAAMAQVDRLASWASFDFDVTIQLRGSVAFVGWVDGLSAMSSSPRARFTLEKQRPVLPLVA